MDHQSREVQAVLTRSNANNNHYRRLIIRTPKSDTNYPVPEKKSTTEGDSAIDVDIAAACSKAQDRAHDRCFICFKPIHLAKDQNRASSQRRRAATRTASTKQGKDSAPSEVENES